MIFPCFNQPLRTALEGLVEFGRDLLRLVPLYLPSPPDHHDFLGRFTRVETEVSSGMLNYPFVLY